MRAGELRYLVTVETRTLGTANAYGQPAETWSTFASVHAAIRPLNGQEIMQAQQLQSMVTYGVQMRYLSGLTPGMRIRYKLNSGANASGTATNGGANYILLANSGTQADDLYNGWGILLTGGTGIGQYRTITDYDHTGHASGERYAQVSAPWDTNPGATTTYVIARWLEIESVIDTEERHAEHLLLCREVLN